MKNQLTSKRIIFITGMSGAGKSAVLNLLAQRGFRTCDTDEEGFCVNQAEDQGGYDWVWNEMKIGQLLESHVEGYLYLSGCVSNQGLFYHHFDEIVLFTAPEKILLQRIKSRKGNPYGKTPEELAAISQDIKHVEPLLRRRVTKIIDTSRPLLETVESLVPAYLEL